MPNMELEGLAQGLEKLVMNYHGVADADMDAMFAQVWTLCSHRYQQCVQSFHSCMDK